MRFYGLLLGAVGGVAIVAFGFGFFLSAFSAAFLGLLLMKAALFAFIAFLLVGYFLPSVLARHLDHPRITQIVILNVLLGWTLFGWIAVIVWVSWPKRASDVTGRGGEIIRRGGHGVKLCETSIKTATMMLLRWLKERWGLALCVLPAIFLLSMCHIHSGPIAIAPEVFRELAFGLNPTWYPGDTSRHLLRWSNLRSIDVVGRDLLPSSVAEEFNKALDEFAKTVNKPVPDRTDIPMSSDGELSDLLALNHSRISSRILIMISEYSGDDYLSYLAASILGTDHPDIYVVPVTGSAERAYLGRWIFAIHDFDIQYAILVINSHVMTQLFYEANDRSVRNAVYNYLVPCLNPLFLENGKTATFTETAAKYQVGWTYVVSQYVQLVQQSNIRAGMSPDEFIAAIGPTISDWAK